MPTPHKIRSAFSLIELVVIVVILGILAAVTIPRLSHGSAGIADATLDGNLAVLRNAVELYANEHDGAYPALATFDTQLTQYTDAAGNPSTTKDDAHSYGPYLRKVPTLPVGPTGYRNTNTLLQAATAPGATPGAWLYNPRTGDIKANLPDAERDSAGKQYNTY